MARPTLPLGTHGRIRVYRLGPKRFRARTKVRDHDGRVREVERTGPSASRAENLLKEALRDRKRSTRGGEITGESTVRALGELWLAEIDRAVRLGKGRRQRRSSTGTASNVMFGTGWAGCGCGS